MFAYIESLRMALSAIWGNKLRAALTTLGIIIGILAVTLMGTLISGLDRSFEKSMSFLGRDVLYIAKHEWFGEQEWWEIRNRPDLKVAYVEKLKSQSKYVKAAAPVTMRTVNITREDEMAMGINIAGTTPEYMQTAFLNIESGRFFTEGEDRSGTRVIVIGYDVANALFENENPIGEKVKIGNYVFRVVGVTEKQGKFLGLFSMDNRALIPLGTYQRLFSRRGWMRLDIKVDENHIADAKDEITAIMRNLRGLHPEEKNDFAINQQDAFRQQYQTMKIAIGGTGIFITVLSLVVGGIGIMNIMFVSVKERTREIGVRKAIGATPSSIMRQFLFEALLICLFGGFVGMVMALGGSILIDKYIFPSTLPVSLAITALVLSSVVGLIAGLAPSFRAARLDPIEALRYE
ncbi:MAG TPA: ABC transporter permease [Candidatus Marinimicrobia bacterium]|jgi:putative ABC transport system permease protein|nr:ABC transporter [Candidatus Neomarinimicrobiota bacterium]MDP6276107.1 ABC transporter permease [Candidatus Neomarinimicrobiota bacterium]MDP7217420.1 ABC transporter permease [Candidatus Neomarinimicrobiota bacterium]MDP7436593.1 ABC transporter permease [Candidatus Neomarinimicrobiota bacterium]HBN45528.1 ABC transporter [Candidatus Neomarinimicrobiota bacterium]|tara:strand:+ start:25437 stop:26651 length:1215 start_codon:yes stop_codon:yes gene_type:complete